MEEKVFNGKFKAMLAGDKAAFAEIYNEIKTPVFTVIYRIVGKRDDAEDVMQDVFLRLLRHDASAPVLRPRAYIFMMAHNMAVDKVRKKGFEELPEDLPDGDDTIYGSCVRMDVESALAALPLGEREAVLLHLSAGLKFREIAKILGVPQSTVFSRYDSAIKKLRQML